MSAGQVVLVTFGFLIASSLVFIFGMWVGKDLAERRLAQEERVFRAPVARPPEVADARPLPPTAGFAPATTPSPVYQLLLDPHRPPTPIPIAPTATATLNLVVVSPVRTVPRMVPTPLATAASEEEWADAGWTVQVTATTDGASADAIAARLRSRGYDAYTLRAPNRGQIWYRVRVGRFATRTEAAELEGRLKATESFTGAFVTAR